MERKTAHQLACLITETNSLYIIPPIPSAKGFTVGIMLADYNPDDSFSGVAIGEVKIRRGETILVEMDRKNIAVLTKSTGAKEIEYLIANSPKGFRTLSAVDLNEVLQEISLAEDNYEGFDLRGALAWNDLVIYDQKRANIVARASGFGRATEFVYGAKDKVLRATACGYRKKTTGEYVGINYRRAFGWKNTYYQPAECIVQLAKQDYSNRCAIHAIPTLL